MPSTACILEINRYVHGTGLASCQRLIMLWRKTKKVRRRGGELRKASNPETCRKYSGKPCAHQTEHTAKQRPRSNACGHSRDSQENAEASSTQASLS